MVLGLNRYFLSFNWDNIYLGCFLGYLFIGYFLNFPIKFDYRD